MALAPIQSATSNQNDNPNAFGPNRPAGTSQGDGTSAPANATSMGGGTTPPVIPIGTATGNVQAPNLPNKPVSDASGNLTAAAGGYIQPPNQPSQPPQQGGQIQETGNYKQDFLNQIDAISTRPGELNEQFGIQKKLEDYNAAKTKYDLLKESYRVQKEREMMNGALSADQKQARIGELERKEAFSAGTLAIEFAAKQQDYVGAKELMNQQLQLELEPIKMKADFYRDMYMKTEDQRFARQMKAEDRAYEERKAAGELANDLKLAALGRMSPEKADKFAKDPAAKRAMARVNVMRAVKEYTDKLALYKGRGLDFNRLTAVEKRELQAMVDTTIGPALSVAAEQGAMTGPEAEAFKGSLLPSRGRRTISYDAANKGIQDAQSAFLKGDLDLLEMSYPGARNLSMFAPAQSDEEFFSGATSSVSVPATSYFNVDI